MFKSLFFASCWVLFLTTSSLAQVAVNTDEQCACPFAGFGEEGGDGCYIYGPDPAGGTGMVAYPKASLACIQNVGASNGYLTDLEFFIMCPHPNHTDFNLEKFVILLRQNTETEAAQYVMSQFINDMDFAIFAKNETTDLYGLPPVIENNVQGRRLNCTQDSPQLNQCWDEVKTIMPGKWPRFDIICKKWHDEVIPALYAEQGTARRLVCQGGFNESQLEECENIKEAIAQDTSNCAALEQQVTAQQSGVRLCNQSTPPPPRDGAVVAVGAWTALFLAVASFTLW